MSFLRKEETMPHQGRGSLRRMITVGVAMAIAGFIGVSSASGADPFESVPGVATAMEEHDRGTAEEMMALEAPSACAAVTGFECKSETTHESRSMPLL